MLDKNQLLESYTKHVLEPIEAILKRLRYLYYEKHNTKLKPLLDCVEDNFIYFLKKYEELL